MCETFWTLPLHRRSASASRSVFNVSSTVPRTNRSRWFLIRSSSIEMTLPKGLGVFSVMAAPSCCPGCVWQPPVQPDSGPPALLNCAKHSVRHPGAHVRLRRGQANGVVIGNSTDIDRVQVQWDDTGEITHCPKADLEVVLHA